MRILVALCLAVFAPLLSAQEAAVTAVPVPGPAAAEAPPWRWSLGTALEIRGQQEINPQYLEARYLPQLFAQVRYFPYTLMFETSYEQRHSSTGQLSIATKSVNVELWGRYEFGQPLHWSPFASVGVGSYFDSIDFNYADGEAATARKGRRDSIGLGGGINHAFFKHFLQELEARAVLIEGRKDIAWTFIYRLGLVY